MTFIWRLGQIPELAALPSAERTYRWQSAYFRSFGHWLTWVSLSLFCAFVALGGYLGSHYFASSNQWSEASGSFIAGIVGAPIYFQFVTAIVRRHYTDTLLGNTKPYAVR